MDIFDVLFLNNAHLQISLSLQEVRIIKIMHRIKKKEALKTYNLEMHNFYIINVIQWGFKKDWELPMHLDQKQTS